MAQLRAWPVTVLSFWFEELLPENWFVQSNEIDHAISARFGDIHKTVADAPLDYLLVDDVMTRAAIIVLDQFPRNIFRDDARAFATDAKALKIAKAVIARGGDAELTTNERLFVYLPYEHSEAINDQDASVELFRALGDERYLEFAIKHRDVIACFGRFPHRNGVLGRQSTAEELAFLDEQGRGF